MPSGKVHNERRESLIPLVFTITALLVAMFPSLVLVWLSMLLSYTALARYIDPDLDLLGMSLADGRMVRELWLVGAVLSAWFFLYAWTMWQIALFMRFVAEKLGVKKKDLIRAGHRGFLSHGYVISTVLRVAWMDLPLLFLPFHIGTTGWQIIAGQFLGLLLADSLHIWLDARYTETGKRRKKKK